MQTPGRAALPPGSNFYTDAQVVDRLLRAPNAKERWKFDLLAADLTPLGDITPLVYLTPYEGLMTTSLSVGAGATGGINSQSILTVDTTSDVQATLDLATLGNPMDELNQLIRPHYQIQMPNGDWIDFVLGLFNALPNGRSINLSNTSYAWALADSGQLLSDAGIQYAMGVGAGTNYIQAITTIVESYGGKTPIPVMIPDTGLTVPAALTWDAGTSRLSIVNDLLSAMNYYPAWFDQNGNMRSSPIPDYRTVTPSLIFDTDKDAILYESMTTQPDFSSIYNQFLLTVQNPTTSVTNSTSTTTTATTTASGQGFSAYYENDDPLSPISTVNWHPKLYSWQDSSIADQATAYRACVTQAQICERIYSPITFDTPAWPLSQSNDIYQMHIRAADEPETSFLYIETAWAMTIGTGQYTTHTFEQISFGGGITSFT